MKGCAGFEGKREDKRVQCEGKRRVDMVEKTKGFLVTATVDVRSEELSVGKQTEVVR